MFEEIIIPFRSTISKRVVIGRVIFGYVSGKFRNLQTIAVKTLKVMEYIPKTKHHFFDIIIWIIRGISTNAAC